MGGKRKANTKAVGRGGKGKSTGRKGVEKDVLDDEESCGESDYESAKKPKKQKGKAIPTKKAIVGSKKARAKAKSKPRKTTKQTKSLANAETEPEEEGPQDARKHFKKYQKHITPPNGDGTRAFYESLLSENPFSVIALKYCIEYGVLTGTKFLEAMEKYEKLTKEQVLRGRIGGLNPIGKQVLTKKVKKPQEKGSTSKKKA